MQSEDRTGDVERLTPGNKVANLGVHFRLTQEGWAEVLGINRNTLASYKHRKNANPATAKIREWGERFGVPFAWFFDGIPSEPPVSRDHVAAEREARTRALLGEPVDSDPVALPTSGDYEDGRVLAVHPDELTYEMEDFATSETYDIPVWEGVIAGLDDCHFVEDGRPKRTRVPKFFFSRKNPERFITCLPKGISMAPRIISPDRVISFLNPDPPPNSLVVARRDDGINFMKVLRVDRMGRKSLHSIHPDFPPIENLEGWTLRAVVVGIWKPYEMNGTNIEFNGGFPLRG